MEACSGFTVLHGQAVAIGMAAITRSALAKGFCSRETLDELLELLRLYKLPTDCPYGLEEMYSASLLDKKFTGGKMHLIVPEEIGRCRIEAVAMEDIRDWMEAGGIRP